MTTRPKSTLEATFAYYWTLLMSDLPGILIGVILGLICLCFVIAVANFDYLHPAYNALSFLAGGASLILLALILLALSYIADITGLCPLDDRTWPIDYTEGHRDHMD